MSLDAGQELVAEYEGEQGAKNQADDVGPNCPTNQIPMNSAAGTGIKKNPNRLRIRWVG
jgi:hypothetical protein